MTDYRLIEVRGFKWPRRATAVAAAYLLGEDVFGQWLGIASGSPWRTADGARSGVFERSFVKLVPSDSFWTACFHPVDPLVDVDIVLPVRWYDSFLEEVDLELDILRSTNGRVTVRDQHAFEQVREAWGMPDDIATQATITCEYVRALVEQQAEPFHSIGHSWLTHFLTYADTPRR